MPFEDLPVTRVRKGQRVVEKVMLMKTQERETYIGVSGTPIFDENHNFLMGVICSRDVGDHIEYERSVKEKQEALLEAEVKKKEALENTIRMKDEFLSLISHEFKTPLTVISSAIQAMDYFCRGEMPERANKYIDSVRQNTNRQLRLVNNLLDITRMSAGRIKLVEDVYDIVHLTKSIVHSMQIFARQKGVQVSISSEFPGKDLVIDEEKYERILLNLLSNALKFTPGGKSIHVSLSAKRYRNRKMVAIHVADQGIGIPRDKQTYIFERFGQVDTSLSRQAEGTGIGLHLVKLFTTAMGGQITLKSKEGEGSTFTLLLPAAKKKSRIDSSACDNRRRQLGQGDSRLIHTANIEFTDIYT